MTRPVTVFHITDALNTGGTERILVDLVNGLWRRGVGVGVCVTRQGIPLAQELEDEVPLVVLDRQSKWDLKPVWHFIHLCQRQKVVLLHAHGRGSVHFGALVKVLSRPTPKLLFHDHFGEIGVDRTASITLRGIGRYLVDHYLAVDPALHQWALKHLGRKPESTTVLANAIDMHRFNNGKLLSKESLGITKPMVAVMVANLRPQKDHLVLLEAFAQAPLAREKIHLLFVGLDLMDEYSRSCYATVEALGLAQQVSFLGKRLDIPQLLQIADIGLLSSRSESGPVVLLEYAISRLPFVATLTGQVAHFFAAHNYPFLVPPGDITAYALALDQIVTLSTDQREEFVAHNQQLVQAHFGVGRQVEQLLPIYNKLGVSC